jgi:hypothetical protein
VLLACAHAAGTAQGIGWKEDRHSTSHVTADNVGVAVGAGAEDQAEAVAGSEGGRVSDRNEIPAGRPHPLPGSRPVQREGRDGAQKPRPRPAFEEPRDFLERNAREQNQRRGPEEPLGASHDAPVFQHRVAGKAVRQHGDRLLPARRVVSDFLAALESRIEASLLRRQLRFARRRGGHAYDIAPRGECVRDILPQVLGCTYRSRQTGDQDEIGGLLDEGAPSFRGNWRRLLQLGEHPETSPAQARGEGPGKFGRGGLVATKEDVVIALRHRVPTWRE